MKKILAVIMCLLAVSAQAMELPRANGSQTVNQNKQEANKCSICRDSTENNNCGPVYIMCENGHTIHSGCYVNLLKTSKLCPECRKQLLPMHECRILTFPSASTINQSQASTLIPANDRISQNQPSSLTINASPAVNSTRQSSPEQQLQIAHLKKEIAALKNEIIELKGLNEALSNDGEIIHKEKLLVNRKNEEYAAQHLSIKNYLAQLEKEKSNLKAEILELKKINDESNSSFIRLRNQRSFFAGITGFGLLSSLYFAPEYRTKIALATAGLSFVGYTLHKWGII